jgi:alpha-N-arabinofuranosidase
LPESRNVDGKIQDPGAQIAVEKFMMQIAKRSWTRSALWLAAFGLSFVSAAQTRQAHPVNVTIDASKTGPPISKYLYGQFLEHAGGLVNESVWAEMLDDRKFYYLITSKPPEEAPAPAPGRRRRPPPRRWTPIGGDQFITMDAEHPYTGDHTPRIQLDNKELHGFAQTGLSVLKGKSYSGRIILAGSSGAVVKVSLVSGTSAGDRQTIAIHTLGVAYKKFPLRFESTTDTNDARLEITATGTGAIRVGAVSLMPADNLEGFRPEVVAALKQLHSGVYRFPGGNFVSSYEWRNGIGEIDKRPPIYDPVWHAVQPNDVGTDEFLTLCRLLGVDPYITVNAGFGDAWSAKELVEYTNGAVTTPMGKWRAANGHPQPYNFKLWGIGNEPWGDYQMGAMSTEQYALKHNMFAKAMRSVDPSITLIAGGAMPDVMTGANQSKRIGGKFVPDYLSTADWSGYMLAHDLDSIDMLSEHYYSASDMHTDLKLEKKVNIGPQPLIEWERAPATQVRVKYEHYQEYLKLIPALRAKPVPIAIDEWAYMSGGPPSYKVVPAYAWAFHEMFRHSGLFKLAAFTFATAMMSENRTEAELNPTGLLFMMYRDHFGTIPVDVSGD